MSLDALQNTLPPVTVADLDANGRAPMDAPRWRIRLPQYQRVQLAGEFAGAWVDLLLNPSMDLLTNISTNVGIRWHLHKLIRAWNFEDADGRPLEVTEASVGQLDDATTKAIMEAWSRARELPKSGG